MNYRWIAIAAFALLLTVAGCPRPGGEGKDQQASQVQSEQVMPEKKAVIRANPISTIEKLVNAMNKKDFEGYKLLLAPDGPAYDELITKFEQFDNTKATITLNDVSVQSRHDTEVTVIYDLKTEFTNAEVQPEYENGRFKLRYIDSQWLVWSVS